VKTGIVEPEVTAVAKDWLCKRVYTATKPRDRRNTRKNRGAVGGGVLCWVRADVILGEIADCYIRNIITRVQLKKSMVVGVKELDAKRN
jgi:hypothetical protein